MKTYFLSSQPCALTINQAFFGVTDGFERFAELTLSDNLFIQFTPQNALPISFFLTENVRFTAPAGVEVYFVKDGIALYAKDFPPTDFSLHTIAQEKTGNLLVTVFRQGTVQATFQTDDCFFTATLSPSFTHCDIQFHAGLVFLASPTELYIFTVTGKRVFAERICEYAVNNDVLSVVLPLSDSLGRYAHCEYALTEQSCTRISFKLSQARAQNGSVEPKTVQTELLAFAFFQTVLLGGDFSAFLSDVLQEKSAELCAFLGDFVAVTPTDNPLCCGLIRPIGERIFETRYFTVELHDGKICDIKG